MASMKIILSTRQALDGDVDPGVFREIRRIALEAAQQIRETAGVDVGVEFQLLETTAGMPASGQPEAAATTAETDKVVQMPTMKTWSPRARSHLARQHEERKSQSPQQNGQDAAPEIILRPAWRCFYKHYLVMTVALAVTLLPHKVLALAGLPADTIANLSRHGILGMMSFAGALTLFSAIAVVVMFFYAHRYIIGRNTVESHVGIVARRVQRLEYVKITGVEIDQSVIERMLGIGRIEIATANTGGVEVCFMGVARPMLVQEEVSRRKRLLEHNDGVRRRANASE